VARHTAPHFTSQLIVKEEPHTDSIRQCVAPIRVEDTPIRVESSTRIGSVRCTILSRRPSFETQNTSFPQQLQQ